MALTIRHFDLYIIPNIASPPVLDISQYDTSRSFVAHLKDLYGNPYSLPSGATAILEGKNKNSVVFRIETIINNDTITFIPDDVLTDTFGRIHATISIEQASQALSPLKVIFNVQRAGITKEEKTINPDFKDAVAAAFQAYIDEHGSGGSGSGEMNVQSDWNQTNINSDAYIKNKPTRLSQFQNDSDFISFNETPYVTPEQYGAVGDGVVEIVRDPETNAVTAINVTGTDDTNAIQAALNDGNLVLCANNKTYIVTSSLQINGGTILDLNGSTFQTGNDIPIIVENQNNSAVSKVVIRNGFFGGTRFYGDGSSFTNQCGIRIRSFQSVYDNLRFDYFNYGIYMDARSTGTGTLVENRILNSKFANCMNAAIYNETGTKVTDGILNNVKIGGTGYDYGIYLKQAGGWQISNLHIYGADLTVGAEFRNCDATLLNNIYIGGNHSTAGLILHDYSHVELSNAVIQANTARTNGLWAQTSTSQRWEKKPILLSNVVFSSNAAAGSEIFAIRGGGDIQTVNVIYNDQYGAFVDSRIEPTDQDPSHIVKEAKVDEFGYDIYYPLDNGKELTNNKDFNTIIEPGNYIVTKSAVAQSAINIPEVANGRLVVSNPTGTKGTNRYLRQEYRTYSTTNAIAYERYGTSSDSGETWSWRPWVSVRDSLSTAIPINSNDNLNNYVKPGAWLVRTSQIAQNTANIPVVTPGRLFVMDMLNGYARGESSVYIRQFYVPYTTAKQTYSRYAVYSNGSWTWHEWATSESGGASESLPEPTDADNGKVLGIRNGQYTLLDTGSQYDGQMMTSVASKIAHAMIPAQTVRPSNAYTRRTGIPRIILPWSGYELLTTTTADAELPLTNKLSTIYGKWDALMAQYPGYITKETIGYGEKPGGDSNAYPIYAYTLRNYIPTPDNPNSNPNSQFKFTYDKPQKNLEIIWIGTIHAHEHTVPIDDFKFFSELMKRNTEVTNLLMQNCDFTVIPIMNPYGYEHFNEILNDVPNAGVRCGRVNANGVNLNRNFPEQWQYIEPFIDNEPNNDYAGAEAASESEVQAVMAFLTAHSDAYICINRHTSSEFAPTSVLAYFASIIEEDTKIAFNACRFMDSQMRRSGLYTNYIGTVKAQDFDKVQDTSSRCLYTVQKSDTSGTMDKWYNAVLGLDGFLFEMSPSDHNYANSPWGRETWQRINVTGIGNMLYALMLQNEYISKG